MEPFHYLPLGQSASASDALGNLEGQQAEFKDPYTGGTNIYRLVKNAAGIALTPGRTVNYKAANIYKQVDGYCSVEAARAAGIVDDQLPTAGVPDGYYFWILERGHSLYSTSLAADAGNLQPADTALVAATAATSQATTAGRLKAVDWTGATAVLAGQIYNAVGRAVTARTTANTGTSTLGFFNFLK